MNIFVHGHSLARLIFYQILARMLEACRKSYNNLFEYSSRNYNLFCRENDEVLMHLQKWTRLKENLFILKLLTTMRVCPPYYLLFITQLTSADWL